MLQFWGQKILDVDDGTSFQRKWLKGAEEEEEEEIFILALTNNHLILYMYVELVGFLCLCLQRRNDREEIRRRLAMGPDAEDLRVERGRKPSLQSRLQSGSYRSILSHEVEKLSFCQTFFSEKENERINK